MAYEREKKYAKRLSGAGRIIQIYTPTKQLKDALKFELTKNIDRKIRIFLDIRGSFVNLHDSDAKRMLKGYAETGYREYSRLIIKFVNNWISYLGSEGYQYEIVLFAEQGDSQYHDKLLLENQLPGYKSKRRETSAAESDSELRQAANAYINQELTNANYILSTNGSNATMFFVNNTEIDAAPHAIIAGTPSDDYFNVIFSKDKDLGQLLAFPHTIQVKKAPKGDYQIVSPIEAGVKLLKTEHNFRIELFPVALACIGDLSDSIPGVPGVGTKSISEFLLYHGEKIMLRDEELVQDKFIAHIEALMEDPDFLPESRSVKAVLTKLGGNTVDKKYKLPAVKMFEISFKLVSFAEICKAEPNVFERDILGKYNATVLNYRASSDQDFVLGKRQFVEQYLTSFLKMGDRVDYVHWVGQIH